MDRLLILSGFFHNGIPHTRGDGPQPAVGSVGADQYSPHAWGWTVHGRSLDSFRPSIPHTRGDGPRGNREQIIYVNVFPTRVGMDHLSTFAMSGDSVFPTRVGMDRGLITSQMACGRIPHTRGDGPFYRDRAKAIYEVFPTRVGMDRMIRLPEGQHLRIPHTRGDGPHSHTLQFMREFVFPTRVGMDHRFGFGGFARYSIPHTRGDGPPAAKKFMDWQGVFPTRVGMDQRAGLSGHVVCSIPHTRGDGPEAISASNLLRTYSPHAWGWTVRRYQCRYFAVVFPTRVGMDR